MLLRWVSMCVWAVVAASAVFWGLRVFTKGTPVPPETRVADQSGAVRGDLSRVLGVDALPVQAMAAPAPASDARFNLVGVVSPRGTAASAGGVALIAVDGKTPKAYKVGAVVDGANVLQSINARGAALGPRGGPTLVALNIPPPQAAATGQLPTAVSGGPAVMPPGPPPMPLSGRVPPLQSLTPLPPGVVPPQAETGAQLK